MNEKGRKINNIVRDQERRRKHGMWERKEPHAVFVAKFPHE